MFSNLIQKEKIITRIAPSPTGVMHVGTARTALFNYLFAKKYGGKFILRIEDTDAERSKKEFEDDIIKGLKWLGLEYDEFYRQSDRKIIYKKYINKMIDSGHAYLSKEAGGERSEVIRFKNPNKIIEFNDLVRGKIKFDTTELGDFVIAKSFDEPLYHLVVVVDDYEMGITHIIRGEDGISNTPRQILIQNAIGANNPNYAHLPLILGKDRSKLSKRHGAVSITEYMKNGYLKEAVINYLAFLGWNPGGKKEIYTISELIKDFDVDQITKGGAIFDNDKLDWFNKQHLQKIPNNILEQEVYNFLEKHFDKAKLSKHLIKKLLPTIIERISKLSQIEDLIKNRELDYFFDKPDIDPYKITWKDSSITSTIENMLKVIKILEKLDSDKINESSQIKEEIWNFADSVGKGEVLWPIRYSLSGKDKSPDPFTLIFILGISESINRINSAIYKLHEINR